MNLSKEVKVTQVMGYYAAGQTVRKAPVILDNAGYEGCMFVFSFGTLLNTGVIACDINGNTANATGGTKLAGGASATVTPTTAALTSSAIVVDLYQPDSTVSRYLEAMITPTVANTEILGVVAIQYNGKSKPEVTSQLLAASVAINS
jgi:hypothetical protein